MENRYWGPGILMLATGLLFGFVASNVYLVQMAERPYGVAASYGRMGQGVGTVNTGIGMMNQGWGMMNVGDYEEGVPLVNRGIGMMNQGMGMINRGMGLKSTLAPISTMPMMGFTSKILPVNITDEQAYEAVRAVIASGFFGSKDFRPADEIIKFRNGWEIEVIDASGNVVYEFIVDPSNGNVFPEMGPNMMWNTRFGMMGQGMMGRGMMQQYWTKGQSKTPFTVSEEQARTIVADYIKQNNLDVEIEEVEMHPGYWEMHLVKDGKLVWQIDVNGYTGTLWLETWHVV